MVPVITTICSLVSTTILLKSEPLTPDLRITHLYLGVGLVHSSSEGTPWGVWILSHTLSLDDSTSWEIPSQPLWCFIGGWRRDLMVCALLVYFGYESLSKICIQKLKHSTLVDV